MNHNTKIISLIITIGLLSACAHQQVNVDYTAFKQSRPRSILVLPPVNSSPDVNASLSMLSVATVPLAEAGYYVMPVTLVSNTLKQNGMTEASDAQKVSLTKLREIFGADAALYIDISKYGASYRVISSVVEVKVSAKLIDLRTGVDLWQGEAYATNEQGNSGNNVGLVGILVKAVVDQIAHNIVDDGHKVAGIASQRLLSAGHPGSVLYGPYHPKYGTD